MVGDRHGLPGLGPGPVVLELPCHEVGGQQRSLGGLPIAAGGDDDFVRVELPEKSERAAEAVDGLEEADSAAPPAVREDDLPDVVAPHQQRSDVVCLDVERGWVTGETWRQFHVADAPAVEERLVDPVRRGVEPGLRRWYAEPERVAQQVGRALGLHGLDETSGPVRRGRAVRSRTRPKRTSRSRCRRSRPLPARRSVAADVNGFPGPGDAERRHRIPPGRRSGRRSRRCTPPAWSRQEAVATTTAAADRPVRGLPPRGARPRDWSVGARVGTSEDQDRGSLTAFLRHSEQGSAPIETVLQRRDGNLKRATRPRVPLTPRGGVASLSPTRRRGWRAKEPVQPGSNTHVNLPFERRPTRAARGDRLITLSTATRAPGRRAPVESNTAKVV